MKDKMLNQVTKRTARYWYVDGLAEIGTGLLFLALAVFYLVLSGFQADGITALAVGLGQPLIILLGIFGIAKAVRFFKTRITFPRTGYVSYRRDAQDKRRKRVLKAGVISAIVAAALVLMVTQAEITTIWLVAGVLGALVPVLLGYRLGLPRFYLLAGWMVALSVALNFLRGLPEMRYAVLFYGGIGLFVMLLGVFTLLRYLAQTRPAEEEQDE